MSNRQYPDRPFVGVGAVILDAGMVVLVRRGAEPLRGQWSLPGGAVEVGETLEACVVREIEEETGLRVQVGPVIEVLDRITRDSDGRVRYHFVLVDYLCRPIGGELRGGSDADEARLVAVNELDGYALTSTVIAVIARALELAREAPRAAR